ncbi:glycosyl hydrolase family 26 [Streptomyces sp. 1114.5]|uniref:glycoside hydrolase family 26 protein n=1 Tax=Streptomyces sp. 1114.5 TaxID=1938830 RepID=UPI000F12F5FD|nr:glycosyl hydrolase [Streptomyces sp. 1114.5]RKT15984.1 glycosyl hydrolase family 26 [Streptomyces sp. 1114.5]
MTAHPRRAGRLRRRLALPLLTAGLLLLTGCGPEDPGFAMQQDLAAPAPAGAPATPGTAPSASTATAVPTQAAAKPKALPAGVPYDVTPLLKPTNKYLGAALPGVPATMDALPVYGSTIGKQPNVLEFYAHWKGGFDTAGVRRIHDAGALPFMAWEPHEPSLAAIAAGDTDDYVRGVAKAVAKLNLPIAISIAHEMNGDWYPWGRQAASPEDFVAAWRHVHDLFDQAGATNVIWVWSPNITVPAPNTRLAPYYPGDTYVDWAGMTGYFTNDGPKTFEALYGPTMAEIRTFSQKPFFISETAAEQGRHQQAFVDQLFSGMEAHDDIVGFIWFNMIKRADWRVETVPDTLAAFKKRVAAPRYGFDLRNP